MNPRGAWKSSSLASKTSDFFLKWLRHFLTRHFQKPLFLLKILGTWGDYAAVGFLLLSTDDAKDERTSLGRTALDIARHAANVNNVGGSHQRVIELLEAAPEQLEVDILEELAETDSESWFELTFFWWFLGSLNVWVAVFHVVFLNGKGCFSSVFFPKQIRGVRRLVMAKLGLLAWLHQLPDGRPEIL